MLAGSRCLQSGGTGFISKVNILNKKTTTPDFLSFFFFLQQLQACCKDRILVSSYATALCVCVFMQYEPRSRRGGGISRGNVTPTSQESRKSKSINNAGVQKLRSNPSTAERELLHRRPCGLFAAVSAGQPRDVTEGRRKTLSPNVPPLAIDVTTCRQRTAMFCWLCRHGEEEEEEKKVDTMSLLGRPLPPRSQRIKVKLERGGENVQLTTWRTHFASTQV